MVPALLALATAIVFGPFLLPGNSQMLSKGTEDLATQYAWWRKFGFGELAKGHLALWDNHLFCGMPFFGNFQPALLYPLNWGFMFLPLIFAVNSFIAVHTFLMGYFTYLWVWRRGSQVPSALLAAFMGMFGAAFFLRIIPGHLINIGSMPWIPFLLLCVDSYRLQGKARWVLGGMFAFAMLILSGQFQIYYYTAVFVGTYVLLTSPRTQEAIRFLGGFFLMASGGIALGAVQLLAAWDAARESLRGQGMPLDIVDTADITPERFWSLLMPNFFGGWKDYWGGGIYWEGVTYVSLTAFVLALFALKVSHRPQKRFFGWAALFLMLLAIGKRGPFFLLFYKYFPLFSHFRGVGKVDILITLCFAALAAMGLDEILENPSSLRALGRRLGAALWVSGILGFVFVLLSLLKSKPYLKFASHWFAMEESILVCVLVLAFLYLLSVKGRQWPILRYGFLVLALLELFIFVMENRISFDFPALALKVSRIHQVYQQDPGDYRVLANLDNYALGADGLDVWGYDTSVPARYAHFLALAQDCDPEVNFFMRFDMNRFPPVLGLLRLRYVFHDAGDGWDIQRLHLKEAPRIFAADQWEILPEAEGLKRVMRADFDPQQKVFLETDPGTSQVPGTLVSQVSLKEINSDELRIDAKVSKPAVLVLTDNYSRGWKAESYPDPSREIYKVLPADGFLRAVPLTAGEHHLRMFYRPAAYVIGKWTSIFSWLIFAAFLFWKRKMMFGMNLESR
jgi:hypothetical protein